MKLLGKPYLYISIILLLLALIFLYGAMNPASKTVNKFMDALIDPSQELTNDYIIPELQNDPFLNILKNQGIILEHKTLKTRRNGMDRARVNSVLTTKYGSIHVWFHVAKLDNTWLITQLPKTKYVEASVPLKAQKKDKNLFEYQIDIGGTHLYCLFPSMENSIEMGVPTSLTLIGDYILDYQHLTPLHLNRIMSTSNEHIEDELIGNIPIEGPLKIYKMSQSQDIPVYLEDQTLPIGINNVTLYRSSSHKNKSLIAYIDPGNFSYNTIRVALNDTTFQSLVHSEVQLTSPQGLLLKNPVEGFEHSIDKNEEIIFRYDKDGIVLVYYGDELLESSPNRWYVYPNGDGIIIINSIERAQVDKLSGTPYRGNVEIASNPQGISLINEVDLEEYLYSVVPSEMPVKFGLESLKVQAITARAYGVKCFKSRGFAHLGAHVDDSTASQVYNNIQENPAAVQAVDETRGLIPMFEDQVIDARFFSTSYGYTANFHEVWSVDNTFPSAEVPYLVAKPQFSKDVPSLHNEANFKTFIDNTDFDGYDRFAPFFRWTLSMTREQLETVIHDGLKSLQEGQSEFILTRDKDGTFYQEEIPDNIGDLQNISIITRGQGGNVVELEITTTKGVYRIIKELNIRQLLKPINLVSDEESIELKRHDGSVVKDFSILPSAFFYMDLARNEDGDITQIIFNGGGYGHGVGMSQYGAYGLSLLGKSYKDIIEHYYPGSQLHNLY